MDAVTKSRLKRDAKASMFRVLGNQEPDAPLPDEAKVIDDDLGVAVRLSYGDRHVQKLTSWGDLELGRFDIIQYAVKDMLQRLAHDQHD